ncbi:MAG: VanZ family protein [Candidatus Omnitrophota bacterium]
MKFSKKLKWVTITLGYVLVIFLLSFRNPGTGSYSLVKEILTNSAHLPLYGVLGYFILVMLKHFRFKGLLPVYAIAIGMSVAVADESFQSFVPGRHIDPMDLILDLIGICLSMVVFNIVRAKIKKQKKQIVLGET